ncbi:phosphatase PAP2 family protein [Rhodobacteraceae bacterium KMM 6894]|nr:phosphatase PAP2 family protein [Rhodobacteraceae bacterium KMM 6894]
MAGWDRALNLNWMGYFNTVISEPLLFEVLDGAYTSLTFLSIVVLLLVVSFGYIARAREFVDTFMITAVICIVVGAAFPAKAAVLTLIPDLSTFEHIGWVPGTYHMTYMEALRDPSVPILLNPADLPGLATFPSFHTASGILIISASRKTWLNIPAWIYSTVMIAATPVSGGHYFIDLIAGGALAVMVVKLVHYFSRKPDKSARSLPFPAFATS